MSRVPRMVNTTLDPDFHTPIQPRPWSSGAFTLPYPPNTFGEAPIINVTTASQAVDNLTLFFDPTKDNIEVHDVVKVSGLLGLGEFYNVLEAGSGYITIKATLNGGVSGGTIQAKYHDFSDCRINGWKAVRAKKTHHGRNGFIHGYDGCVLTKASGSDAYGDCSCTFIELDKTNINPPVKYLAETRYGIVSSHTTITRPYIISGDDCTNIGSETWDVNYDAELGFTSVVDPHSGCISISGSVLHSNTETMTVGADGGTGDYPGWSLTIFGIQTAMHIDTNCGITPDSLSGATGQYDFTLHSDTSLTAEWQTYNTTETSAIYCTLPGGAEVYIGDMVVSKTISSHVSITLSQPYTQDDVVADIKGLTAYWDLTNNAQYPFRNDHDYTSVPLVSYSEYYGERSPSTTGWNVTSTTSSADIIFSYLKDSTGIADGLNADAHDANRLVYTGDILGKPNPGGYEPFFKFDEYFSGVSYGQFTPASVFPETSSMPATATQWTFEGKPNYGWNIFDEGNQTLFTQKWCETKIPNLPSHDFFRPCGADRTLPDPWDCPSGSLQPFTSSGWAICGALPIYASILLSPDPSPATLINYLPNEYLIDNDLIDFILEDGTLVNDNGGVGFQITTQMGGGFPDNSLCTYENSFVPTPGLHWMKSHGAPDPQYHTSESRGDYIYETQHFNIREIRENDRLRNQSFYCRGAVSGSCWVEWPDPIRYVTSASNPIVQNPFVAPNELYGISPQYQRCGIEREVDELTYYTGSSTSSLCSPYVICISSDGEVFKNGITYPIPTPTIDNRYGAAWKSRIIQAETDVLRNPATLVEPRISMPLGTPDLPPSTISAYNLRYLTLNEMNDEPTGYSIHPCEYLRNYYTFPENEGARCPSNYMVEDDI